MKTKILSLLFLLIAITSFGQSVSKFYYKGKKKAKAGKYKAAIRFFSKALEIQPSDYQARFHRALAKLAEYDMESGLADLDTTIQTNPNYYPAFMTRGVVKERLTDYEGGIADFTTAIALDPRTGDAYFQRGLIYELLEKKDSACMDFHAAKELDMPYAARKAERCDDTTKSKFEVHQLARLTLVSDDDTYGRTQKNPVKVGKDANGGPGNAYRYLGWLRDLNGKPVKFHRTGSCCMYETENGMNGHGLLDTYEIIYNDPSDQKKTDLVFITFYDFEEPKILKGFTTIVRRSKP
ncbi:MAG TPA: hypothetical protein PLK63_17495 [Catalimonadaceae bacterium]|nr:hypothetical protein [Catalimonadaceae bacterium]